MRKFSAADISALLMTSAATKQDTAAQCSDKAFAAAEMIAASLAAGGKLMLCGNGGSAGDAQHLAAEFVATLDHKRPRDNTETSTRHHPQWGGPGTRNNAQQTRPDTNEQIGHA